MTSSAPASGREDLMLARRLEIPLLLAILISLASLCFAQKNLLFLLAGAMAVGVNLAAVWRNRPLHAERIVINIGVIAATGFLAYELVARHAPAESLGRFLVLVQIGKLFEKKTNRDYVQMLLMSLLAMVLCGLKTGDLWFGLALMAYVALACRVGVLFTLKRGHDASRRALAASPEAKGTIHRVAWNVAADWPARAVRRSLTAVLAFVLVFAIATFLIVPRAMEATNQMLQSAAAGSLAVPTFNDTVRLGEPRNITLSDQVMMYVVVGSGDRLASRLSQGGNYLRAQVFYSYEKSGGRCRWVKRPSPLPPQRAEPPPRLPPPDEALLTNATILRITPLPGIVPHLVAPNPLVRVECRSGKASIDVFHEGTIRLDSDPSSPLEYTSWSLARPYSKQQMAYLREVRDKCPPTASADPNDDIHITPRVAALVQQWCGDLLTEREGAIRSGQFARRDELDLQIANRIADALQRLCKYSLDLTSYDPQADPMEEFLFRVRRGHCEYFATALTVLCRQAGVQARLATGFLMMEYNQDDGRYVVRQSDAHAWTEIYTPSTDWVVRDATPSDSHQIPERQWYAGMKDFWDNLQFLWFQKVITYNPGSRQQFGQDIVLVCDWAWRAIKRTFHALVAKIKTALAPSDSAAAQAMALMIMAAAWLVAVLALMIKAIRRRLRRRSALPLRGRVPAELVKLLRRLLAALARRGLQLQDGQTLRQYAQQAAAEFQLPAPALDALVELYYRARWGQAAVEAGDISSARQQAESLQSHLHQRR